MMTVRFGTPHDAPTAAWLHASELPDAFLPKLGQPFLRRFYRRIARFNQSFILIAERQGQVLGFAAAAEDVRALFRAFMLRDGVIAGLVAAPHLVSSWRSAVESASYPTTEDLPPAELLSLAVTPGARGQGVGHQLVSGVIAELGRRGAEAVRVMVGAENDRAIQLYQACGFSEAADISVHKDTPSRVLKWS